MLRHSVRCISKRTACQVKVEPQTTVFSAAVLRCSSLALVNNNSSSIFGKRLKRRGLVSLRSFSSAARESPSSAEEADEQSTETTDEQQQQQQQRHQAFSQSSLSLPDETRELLRSVLKRTGKSDKPLRQAAGIKLDPNPEITPFTKPSTELRPDPKYCWPLDDSLRHHIRACLSNIQFESREVGMRDTSLSVCTLGTGAGTGSRVRANSATVVKNNGDCYLVDAGEGVSRQFQLSRMDFSSLRKIFITHMHGDHVFGLPGLLLNIQLSGVNAGENRKIEIFGPMGLYNYIAMAVSLCCTELRKLDVTVYELVGGTQRSSRQAGNRRHFKDFQHRGLQRRSMQQNTDGTWTLADAFELDTPEKAMANSEPSGLTIRAAEIHHVPQLQCFGYTFEEPKTQLRNLVKAEELRSLGIDRREMRLLKAGFTVSTPDKSREIHPDEVCGGEAPKARKVTILGDCCMVPPAMQELARNSDVLVHEATRSVNDECRSQHLGGHSTAAQAGAFADLVKAKVLLLNHVSQKLDYQADSPGHERAVVHMAEAENRIRGYTKVQLAYDHMEFMIPRRGDWGFVTYQNGETASPDSPSTHVEATCANA